MQTVARKKWVPQRCSYVHSGKRCGRKRCLSFLSPDWLTKAVVSSRLVTGFRWRWWRRRRLRSSSSPCPLLPKSEFSLPLLGYRKSIWGFEADVWLPYRNSDQIRNQNNERCQSSTMAMCSSSEKQSVRSVPALGTTSYTSLLLFTNGVLFTPCNSQIYSFYHLVLNANKCRMLSSLGLEAEFACKLGDSMNFFTFL